MEWEKEFEQLLEDSKIELSESVVNRAWKDIKWERKNLRDKEDSWKPDLEFPKGKAAGFLIAYATAENEYLTPSDLNIEDNELDEAIRSVMSVYSAPEPGAPGYKNSNPHMFAPEMIESGDLMHYPGIDRDQDTKDALWRKTMSILNEAEEKRFYANKTQNHGRIEPQSVTAGALYNAGKDVTDYLEKSRITQSEVAEASDTNVATVSRYSRELEEEGITGDSVEDLLDPGN